MIFAFAPIILAGWVYGVDAVIENQEHSEPAPFAAFETTETYEADSANQTSPVLPPDTWEAD